MHYFIFIYRATVEDLRRSKIRTLLTSVGILIGIFSVVLLLALGMGLKKYIEDQFKSLGSNLVMVLPGTGIKGGISSMQSMMQGAQFDDKDLMKLKRIKNVVEVAPFVSAFPTFSAEGHSEVYEVIGSSENVFKIMNMEIDKGEFFTRIDLDKGSKVVVLGSKVAEKLFGSAEMAVGKHLKVDDQLFRVIGVCLSKGGGLLGGIDDHVFMPYKSAYNFVSKKKFYAFYLKANDSSQVNQVKNDARETLLKRYKADDFLAADQRETMEMVSSIFNIINSVLVGIAAVSLIVGGVGIMNIMYVSVAEKVGEIGVRRAVGATASDILLQFLAEAVFLSIIGGILGIMLSYIIVFFIKQFFPAYISFWSVILAIGVSSAIGLLFGVLPAKRASDLTPIEAMRHE